ncbi:hypothetical protein D9M72_521180 [compost metagenome]
MALSELPTDKLLPPISLIAMSFASIVTTRRNAIRSSFSSAGSDLNAVVNARGVTYRSKSFPSRELPQSQQVSGWEGASATLATAPHEGQAAIHRSSSIQSSAMRAWFPR